MNNYWSHVGPETSALFYTVVDCFASKPLHGNPVAVFLDADELTAKTMQRIAAEMHLSETTFVMSSDSAADARVRIFTPVNELPYAGHPLLGTAVALGRALNRHHLSLETAMGVFSARLSDGPCDGAVLVDLEQPVPRWARYEHSAELLAALGLPASTMPIEIYCNGPRHVFVGLRSAAALSALDPDHRALSRLPDVAVNCFAADGRRWRMRMLSPAYGVTEDAATGSAAGPLAIHLARHGFACLNQQVEIVQGVEIGRPSLMFARATGTAAQIFSVRVSGHAIVVADAALYVPTAMAVLQ